MWSGVTFGTSCASDFGNGFRKCHRASQVASQLRKGHREGAARQVFGQILFAGKLDRLSSSGLSLGGVVAQAHVGNVPAEEISAISGNVVRVGQNTTTIL